MGRPRSSRPRVFGPYKHGDKWRVHVVTRSGGKRTTSYETFASRDLAEALVAGARDEAQGITVAAAVKAFLDDKRARGKAEKTLIAYANRLDAMVGHVPQRPVRYLNGRGAELYERAQVYPKGHRRAGKRRSDDTHRNILELAVMLGAFCVKRKWLRVNPWAEVEPVGKRRHGADKIRLTLDESRKLEVFCIARSHDKYAVLTLGYLYLGARESELTKRVVRDVDDGGRLLWINRTKTLAGDRRLIVPEPLAGMLRSLCARRGPDAPLFLNERGQRLSESMAWWRVREVCKAAGVPVVPPQALRRTNATLATAAGAAGPIVAAHLGHGRGTGVAKRSYVERGGMEAAGAARARRALRLETPVETDPDDASTADDISSENPDGAIH